jgi:hypothetical protein
VLLPSVYMQHLCPSGHCPARWNASRQAVQNTYLNSQVRSCHLTFSRLYGCCMMVLKMRWHPTSPHR